MSIWGCCKFHVGLFLPTQVRQNLNRDQNVVALSGALECCVLVIRKGAIAPLPQFIGASNFRLERFRFKNFDQRPKMRLVQPLLQVRLVGVLQRGSAQFHRMLLVGLLAALALPA